MHAPFSSFVTLLCVIVVLTNLSTVKPSPSYSSPTAIPTISPSIIAPTFTPSIAPTVSPSTVPVGTDGYVYIQSYTASDCGGSKSGVSGFLANYCYNTGSSYRKYMFTNGR